MLQLQLVNKATGKVEGYIVGKTPNRELVVNAGNRTFTVPINPKTEAKYRIDAVKASTK